MKRKTIGAHDRETSAAGLINDFGNTKRGEGIFGSGNAAGEDTSGNSLIRKRLDKVLRIGKSTEPPGGFVDNIVGMNSLGKRRSVRFGNFGSLIKFGMMVKVREKVENTLTFNRAKKRMVEKDAFAVGSLLSPGSGTGDDIGGSGTPFASKRKELRRKFDRAVNIESAGKRAKDIFVNRSVGVGKKSGEILVRLVSEIRIESAAKGPGLGEGVSVTGNIGVSGDARKKRKMRGVGINVRKNDLQSGLLLAIGKIFEDRKGLVRNGSFLSVSKAERAGRFMVFKESVASIKAQRKRIFGGGGLRANIYSNRNDGAAPNLLGRNKSRRRPNRKSSAEKINGGLNIIGGKV